MSPLAYRYNIPGEHLIPFGPEAVTEAPGVPVSTKFIQPRLDSDITYYHTGYEEYMRKENEQFHPLDFTPHEAPDPIRQSEFVGRPARNPSHAWTYYPAYPDGLGWQEDRFIESFEDAHSEFYPGSEVGRGNTFRYDHAELRRNLLYDRPSTYGEQTAYLSDDTGMIYQDLSAIGGY